MLRMGNAQTQLTGKKEIALQRGGAADIPRLTENPNISACQAGGVGFYQTT